jgi:hypothetical protein
LTSVATTRCACRRIVSVVSASVSAKFGMNGCPLFAKEAYKVLLPK